MTSLTREIKFRGLESLTGNWIYGSLVQVSKYGSLAISTLDENGHLKLTEIDRDTASQNTRFKTQDGQEIYEGDIVQIDFGLFGPVYYDEAETSYVVHIQQVTPGIVHAHEILGLSNPERIIGNIYDNPELLEDKSL